MRVYLDFLRKRHAARLLTGTLIGRLPNGMGALAVVLHVREQGGSYSLAGALAAVYGLATAIGQPALGRVMDRLGQPPVLLAGAGTAAAGFGLFAAVGIEPLPIAIAAVIVAGFATPPLEAGLRALWPHVLDNQTQVRAAYALDAAAQEILFVLGPLLVVATTVVSTETAVLLTGALGVLGTLVVISSRPSRAWTGERRAADWAGPLRSPGVRAVLLSLGCVGIALGVFSVAVVPYGEERGLDYAPGLLLALQPAGALTGGLVYGARRWRGEDHQRLPLLMTGLALGYLPLMAAPALPVMLVLAYLSGIFLAPLLACTFTLMDHLAPRGTVTEAFAWIAAAMGTGFAFGSAVAGTGQDMAGIHGAFAGAGAGGLLALAICLLGRRALVPAGKAVPVAVQTL